MPWRWLSFISPMNFVSIIPGAITFANGDVIKADMRAKQSISPDGVKTRYEVIKVVEHIKRYPFKQLPLSETDESP